MHQQDGKLEDAVSDFSRAIGIESDTAEYYLERAGCYRNLRDYTSALNDLERVIDLEPNQVESYNRRGLIYWKRASRCAVGSRI